MIYRLIQLENPWSNSNEAMVGTAALAGNLTADEKQRYPKQRTVKATISLNVNTSMLDLKDQDGKSPVAQLF